MKREQQRMREPQPEGRDTLLSSASGAPDRRPSTMHIVRNRSAYGPYEQEYLAWYLRCFKNPGKPVDPASLVMAVRAQHPNRPELAEAFARCTREWPRNALYTYFLSFPQRQERWNCAGGFFLDHPTLGTLVVDTIHDKDAPAGISIGGMEYLDRVLGYRMPSEALLDEMRKARKAYEARKHSEEDGDHPAH